MLYRIGIGYDIHRLVKGRPLILGGVRIPHAKGLMGHSDADVLVHAVCDAILGAAAMGDIGEHFPNTDKRYKNVSSLKLLAKVKTMVEGEGYEVRNVDTVVIAQAPKMSPLKNGMIKKIAATLDIKEKYVSIKATTNEGVDDIGKGKAIAAYAAVLLER